MSKQEVYIQIQKDLIHVAKCPLEVKQARKIQS